MIELLQHYSLSEIFIFTILLALAVKSLIIFFDWSNERIKKAFNKQYSKITEKEKIKNRLDEEDQIILSLQKNQQMIDRILQDLQAKIDMLIDSDKDSIKSYITREHHYFCYEKGWIDDFSLDCIEKRYDHYEDQGGNSFVSGLMDQLRALPKQGPQI